MTAVESKLHHDPNEDIPYAEVLPLKYQDDVGVVVEGPKAYAVQYKSYHDEEAGGVVKEATVIENLGWDKETRRLFIRKVYSILSVQLVLTGVVSTFMAMHVPTQIYVLTHGWPVTLSMVASIALIVALMCYKDKHPENMYLLATFTIVEAFLVGTTTTAYCAAGYEGVVLEAVFLTGAIFIGLTLFTFQSKIDFSFLGAALSMGLGALILWGLFAMLFGVQTGYAYALIGCILFSGYILFDTWLIMDRLSPSEYVLAAIMLYLDIINFFLYLLQLLFSSGQQNTQ
jgi:FtsH-binding integral membrane protein